MSKKVKTLITVIRSSPVVDKVLSEIEPYAEIRFLGENETLENYVEDIEVLYGNIDERNLVLPKVHSGTSQTFL
jgi:hypothetical protein